MVDAVGADEKGRGQAAMLVTAASPTAGGTSVEVSQDLRFAPPPSTGGAWSPTVTSVLMKDFASTCRPASRPSTGST